MASYSSRLSWSFLPNSFTKKIAEQRAAGVDLIDLTISNPTGVLSDYPHREIRAAFERVPDYTYHPDPLGLLEARLAVAAYYKRRSIAASPDQILLTASTSEAYALLFKLLCNPGEEVLVPVPSYPLFEYLAALEAVRIVPYALRYDGNWFIDFESVERQISPRTRAIVVVNPNNPTGSFLKRGELETLLKLAEEHRLPLIADEVFQDYTVLENSGRFRTLIGFDDILSFSLNGLSKAAGMPQMKVGWIVVNGPVSERSLARERLELILDTYLSVNTPVQRALSGLFEIGDAVQGQLLARVRENHSTLQEFLRDSPAHCLHLEGGWSAIIQLPAVMTEEAWLSKLLEEQNVIAQPGYFFDMPGEPYLVVSLITAPTLFREGVKRIGQAQRNP